jgi:membrane protein implicated in regulation of membrane protease activity
MLGGNGYLLWSGVAGVVTGALTWLLPLSWEWQGTLFAVLTLLAAWLWSRWLRKRVKRSVRPMLSSTSAGSSWSAAV